MTDMTKSRNRTEDSVRELRPPGWHWAAALVVLAISIGMAALSFSAPSPAWQRAVAALFVVVAQLGLLELSRKVVRLDDEGLYFVRNFRGTRLPRSEIDSVTWASGVGVSLKLVDGRWIPLPEVGNGSQAMTNVIRAWLKRTAKAGA